MKNQKPASNWFVTGVKGLVLVTVLGFYFRIIPNAFMEIEKMSKDPKNAAVSTPRAIDSLNNEIAKRDSVIHNVQQKVK